MEEEAYRCKMEKHVRSWRRARQPVARGQALGEQNTDYWKWKISVEGRLLEEGTGTMEKDVRSWRRARHAVARGRPLEEKTDRWSCKILVGDGWLLEEVTGLERNQRAGEEGRLLDDEEKPVCKVEPLLLNFSCC